MFVLQNATRPFRGIPGLRIEPIEMTTTRSPFDLSLFLREREARYIGYIEYSTDLFDASYDRPDDWPLRTLLEGIVADPDRRISVLPILTEAERHQLLVEWNDTAADYPKDKCIHELFEEQVERTPDAIAVTFERQQLTYQELNVRANQLAHYLRQLNVGPEGLVGICVERSLEMVVGLLGILKAGGAYVPLDPAYPSERVKFMLEDAQVSVVVTQEKCLEICQGSAVSRQPTYVCLDRDWPVIQRESAENPANESGSENLAYVIYTSGSTGQPKAVPVSHGSVVNCLYSIGQRLGFIHRDVMLAVTTISFDIAALELYLPLFVGGTVAVVSREDALEGTELVRRLAESSATVMQATPLTWRMLMEVGWKGARMDSRSFAAASQCRENWLKACLCGERFGTSTVPPKVQFGLRFTRLSLAKGRFPSAGR